MSASAFSLSAAIPKAGFSLTKGKTVIGGLHADQVHHHHCDWCKSWMFTEIEPDMGFVNVRATLLDDASWFTPFIETYTSEALARAKTPAKHSYPEFPPMEAYRKLVADYASQA